MAAPAVASFQLVETAIPQQRTFGDVVFPLVLTPADPAATPADNPSPPASDASAPLAVPVDIAPSAPGDSPATEAPAAADVSHVVEWIRANREWLVARWQRHGAVLLRALPLASAADFNAVVEACGFDELPYVGGAAPRSKVVGRVFTANESPADQLIPFHHEMAQVPEYPHHLFFFCDVPPAAGGETPLLPSCELTRRLAAKHPAFVDALRAKGLRYVRVLPETDDPTSAIGRGWKSTFLTEDKGEAAEKASKLNVTLEWLPDGSVRTVSGPLPALRVDTRPVPGGNGSDDATSSGMREAWFNSMVAAYTGWKDVRNDPTKAVTFGDGEPLPGEAVMDVAAEMEALAVAVPWQMHDVLLVDNLTVQHSRRSFQPPRRILASLAK
eukprot:TRINITY_DN8560_c0_g1_i1.p1 TRINITY_DN8560_c0_g1~~TRINITY_DN8560_c0_g1_i1.p1  ORF type:complete len:385 (-),score=9.23 TRINITY_DN8560_c0_g1_i1:286-1440(-)